MQQPQEDYNQSSIEEGQWSPIISHALPYNGKLSQFILFFYYLGLKDFLKWYEAYIKELKYEDPNSIRCLKYYIKYYWNVCVIQVCS